MNPIFVRKWEEILKSDVKGRMISLKDTSHDAYEIRGRIVEADLAGDDLTIQTIGTTIKFEGERALPHDEESFSGLIDDIEGLSVESDGTIIFSGWAGYDDIHILPAGQEFERH